MAPCKYIVAALLFTVSTLTQAAPGGKEPPAPEQVTGYLGMTSTDFDGNTNMPGLYAACQEDFGGGARVCNTKELFESPNIAGESVPNSGMWVRPYIVAAPGGDQSTHFLTDYSGTTAGSGTFIGCRVAGSPGVAVDKYFVVVTGVDCSIARPAACCR